MQQYVTSVQIWKQKKKKKTHCRCCCQLKTGMCVQDLVWARAWTNCFDFQNDSSSPIGKESSYAGDAGAAGTASSSACSAAAAWETAADLNIMCTVRPLAVRVFLQIHTPDLSWSPVGQTTTITNHLFYGFSFRIYMLDLYVALLCWISMLDFYVRWMLWICLIYMFGEMRLRNAL